MYVVMRANAHSRMDIYIAHRTIFYMQRRSLNTHKGHLDLVGRWGEGEGGCLLLKQGMTAKHMQEMILPFIKEVQISKELDGQPCTPLRRNNNS